MEAPKAKKKVTRVYGKKKAASKSAAIFLQDSSPAAAPAPRPTTDLETDMPSRPRSYDESAGGRDVGVVGSPKREEGKGRTGAVAKDRGGGEDGEAAAAPHSPTSAAPAADPAAEPEPEPETETEPASIASPAPAHEHPPCPPAEPLPARPASPSALDDITHTLTTLSLAPPRAPKPTRARPAPPAPPMHPRTRPQPRPQPPLDPRLAWLTPLLPFSTTPTHPSPIHTWPTILSPQWPLTKIAESSYAEVYKVHNRAGTSILKILALLPPRGPGSRRETACAVADVVSEVRILDLMADVGGFVAFRGAWVVTGRAPRGVVAAWEAYDASPREAGDVGGLGEPGDEGGRSEFPHPARYGRDQVFLVLELGDAGTDLEHFAITTAAELWDIFLGITLALALGEEACEFEHRDLHEGNICLLRARPASLLPPSSRRKLGFSGLATTLLDYTLSRARGPASPTIPSPILSLDLDTNPELFADSDVPQRQIYGRMRAHIEACAPPPSSAPPRKSKSKTKPDEEAEEQHRWQAYRPYTNVLWLHYALEFAIGAFAGAAGELGAFVGAVAEVRALLDPKRGGQARFKSVGEVREWVVERGWVGEGDVAGGVEMDG